MAGCAKPTQATTHRPNPIDVLRIRAISGPRLSVFNRRICGFTSGHRPTMGICARQRSGRPDRRRRHSSNSRRTVVMSLSERFYAALNDPSRFPTPQSTIDAVVCSVRERGLAALQEPANIERVTRCDEPARRQINQRIGNLLSMVGAA